MFEFNPIEETKLFSGNYKHISMSLEKHITISILIVLNKLIYFMVALNLSAWAEKWNSSTCQKNEFF